jgi:hypothetical protein
MGEGSLPSLRRLEPAGKADAAALCDRLVGARRRAQNCDGLEIDSKPVGTGARMAIRRVGTQRASGRRGLAPLRQPCAAWLAALALVLQLGFGGVSHWAAAGASAAEHAVTALSAAIGQEVSLCAGGAGGPGPPGPSYPCCEDCTLCGFACHSSALAPQHAAAPFGPQRIAAAAFRRRQDADAAPPLFQSNGRPRAPPLFA